MAHWFRNRIVETGHVPLFCFFVAVVISFGLVRLSVRLIRAHARKRPRNVKPDRAYVHHMVYGVVLMVGGGVAGYVVPARAVAAESATAAVFGIGTALVLDEFALILHFEDVYWSQEGRASIDAVFVALAVTAMLLFRLRPDLGIERALRHGLTGGWSPLVAVGASVLVLLTLAIVVIALLKGKIWTGLLGLFVPPLIVVVAIAAVRLARPHSPWARWRYHDGPQAQEKMARAHNRERKHLARLGIRLQNLIGGLPDAPSSED